MDAEDVVTRLAEIRGIELDRAVERIAGLERDLAALTAERDRLERERGILHNAVTTVESCNQCPVCQNLAVVTLEYPRYEEGT